MFGQIPRAKSYGNAQYKIRHGRPVCMIGIIIAVISEKIVSTSAARVAGRRHSAFASRKIADSITPAWLIPIQNTKLVMKNPHTTL